MSKIEQRIPDDWHPDTWSSLDQEQEAEQHFEPSPSLIAGLAQLASLVLFVGMIAVWAMVLDGRFPEVPQ